MNIKKALPALFVSLLLVSCNSTKQITYFQDLPEEVLEEVVQPKQIVVQPEDKISIIVNCKDPQLSDLFNLPIITHRVGQGEYSNLGSQSQQVLNYTVDLDGNIDFPVLGKLNIGGKTRAEIAEFVKEKLISEDLVKDPVVTVEFVNLSIAVLGEVKTPGRFSIDRDKVTILDAISRAGDLTIYGRRDNVLVMREEADGKQMAYTIDLTSAKQIYSSPVYYLRQNDVVYVEPNSVRARQSTINGNNVRSTSFWISLASLLTSVAILVFD